MITIDIEKLIIDVKKSINLGVAQSNLNSAILALGPEYVDEVKTIARIIEKVSADKNEIIKAIFMMEEQR